MSKHSMREGSAGNASSSRSDSSRACCEAWLDRGHADTCAASITTELERAGIGRIRTQEELEAAGAVPEWLGDESFHRSHRAALLRKDPEFYGPLFPGALAADPELPYVWPVVAQAS